MFVPDEIDQLYDEIIGWMDDKEGDPHKVFFKLKDVELMQFTGLHDKNGKEIWEGDILSSCPIGYIPETRKPGELGEVVWVEPKKGYHEDPSHGWKIKSKTGLSNITVWLHVTGCGYEEVLGNIYENPELLK